MIFKFKGEYVKYTNYRDEVEVTGCKTLGDALEKLLNDYPQLYIFLMDNQAKEARSTALYFNDEFIWKQEEVQRSISDGDVAVFSRDIPEGEGGAGKIIMGVILIVAAIIISIYSFGSLSGLTSNMFLYGMTMMGAGLVLSGVAELIMGGPQMPSFGSESASSTSTYTFSGIRNTTAAGTPLNIIYGTHRVGGQLLNVYTDVEDKDNYLYAQIGISEGEITDLTNIEINKNPLSQYIGIDSQIRYGTSDQDAIPWFNRVENTIAISSIILNVEEATEENPDPYTGTVANTSKPVEAVKVVVTAPALYYSNPTKGQVATSVKFKIEYKRTADTNWIEHSTQTLSGLSKSEILGEYEIRFASLDYYSIRVSRLTADHSGDMKYGDTIYLKSINELVYDVFTYPYTAILGLKIKATEQLSGSMPTITSLVKGTKVLVPNNYDPEARTYSSQTWDGTFASARQWTNNPVWCLYDLLTNTRYGLGNYYRLDTTKLALIKAQFYLMAKWCDERVNGAPRYTLNLVLDSSKNAYEWLSIIAATMQGTLFYTEGRVWLDIDRPKPITQLFNMSNIEKGSYGQTGTSYKQIPNAYEVQWPNPGQHYEMDMFRVESYDLQTNSLMEERKKAMNCIGVTDLDQCRRLARYALYAGKYCTKAIGFKTGTHALNCMIGDVVGVQHDVPQWGYGGKVVSWNQNTLTITSSADITYAVGHTYEIKLSHKGQAPVTFAVINPGSVVSRTITLSAAPDFTPTAGDVVVLGETSYAVKPFKVLYIKRDTDEKIELKLVEYNEQLYSAAEDTSDLISINTHNYSALQDPVAVSVTNLTAEEQVYLAGDGTVQTGIAVFFTPQNQTLFWESATINYSIEGTEVWHQMPANKSGSVFIPNLQEQQTYKVVATSNFKNGTRQSISQALADVAAMPYRTLSLLGKTAPPANVAGFTVVQDSANPHYVRFSWLPVTDADLSHYEIRKGSDWDQAEIIKTHIKETYYNNYFVQSSGTYQFLVKAVDTSGNYSTSSSASSLALTVEPSDVTGLVATQASDSVSISWQRNPEASVSGYELRMGSSWDSAAVIQSDVAETYYQFSGVTNGNYIFWVKAHDHFGSESVTAVPAYITVVGAPIKNLFLEWDEKAAGWAGTHHNTAVVSGNLSLTSRAVYDSGLHYDDGVLIYDNTSTGSGYYETRVYNLNKVINCKVILDYAVTKGAGDNFATFISLSNDNITWSDYSSFNGGYITAKYFKFKLELSNISGTLAVTAFKVSTDVPDLIQKGTSVAVYVAGTTTGSINNGEKFLTVTSTDYLAVGQKLTIAGVTGTKTVENINGLVVTLDIAANATVAGATVTTSPTTVTFPADFSAPPSVMATITTANGISVWQAVYEVTNKTVSSFDLTIRNASTGVSVGGIADWQATGY